MPFTDVTYRYTVIIYFIHNMFSFLFIVVERMTEEIISSACFLQMCAGGSRVPTEETEGQTKSFLHTRPYDRQRERNRPWSRNGTGRYNTSCPREARS